jgi:IS30 family transposase
MKSAPRLTAAEKVELWRRWRAGQSLSDIARHLKRSPPAVFSSVRHTGGFSPVPRKRSPNHLSFKEREMISRGIASRKSVRAIARSIGRAPSTVSREIRRNSGHRYRAIYADRRAWRRARRPKACLLATNPTLRKIVAHGLKRNWSPQQIAGRLKRGKRGPTVSHETIYKSLFVQARNVLKRKLCAHLRTGRLFRKGRTSTNKGQPRGAIIDAVSIRERPPEVEDRAVPGHWEGDLLAGAKNSHIATLVERRSRYVILVHVAGKDSVSVIRGLKREIRKLPSKLRRTITWDRGMEMAYHKKFTVATNVQLYFCDPQSPWQRGSNENTNGLLRQYFPDGTDVSGLSQRQLDRVARQLNERPRQTLDWKTPAEVFRSVLR